MGTQKNRLNERVLLRTQNICLKLWVGKYLQVHAEIFCLSKPMPTKAKKRKCLVSGYPTNPNILGPTQTISKTFGIFKSIFTSVFRYFILFHTQKFP